MALRNGIDTVSWISAGLYSETYVSSTGQGNLNALFASLGMLESASPPVPVAGGGWFITICRFLRRRRR